MAVPNALYIHCSNCRVSSTCPKEGSSPLKIGNKIVATCRLIGGYGRTPVDPALLSAESLLRSQKDGPCLTIAEIPATDPSSGKIVYETVKIFNHPVLHAREKAAPIDHTHPRGHK